MDEAQLFFAVQLLHFAGGLHTKESFPTDAFSLRVFITDERCTYAHRRTEAYAHSKRNCKTEQQNRNFD
jgi:hypothetical protein